MKKYLNSEAYLNDPAVQELITVLRAKEIEDLTLLGAKARAKIHELLDGDKVKIIEATAVMDRSFQQRRLLQGESTHNIESHRYILDLKEHIERLDARKKELESKIEKKLDSEIDEENDPL